MILTSEISSFCAHEFLPFCETRVLPSSFSKQTHARTHTQRLVSPGLNQREHPFRAIVSGVCVSERALPLCADRMERSRDARAISRHTERFFLLFFYFSSRGMTLLSVLYLPGSTPPLLAPSRPVNPPVFLVKQKPSEHAKKSASGSIRRESALKCVSLSALRDLPTAVTVAFCFCGKGEKEDEWRGKGDR